MSRKVRCLPSLLRPRPHRGECRASACPSRAHFSIFHGQHFGLILFFHPARGNDERRKSGGAPLFSARLRKQKNNTKKFCAPRFPRNDGRKRRASRNADAGRFALFRSRRGEGSNAPGPPCLAAKRPRIMLLWSKSIPDPSCGQCSGRRDGPRPWPE